jgi:hypothetical protein
MSVTVTPVVGAATVWGNKRAKVVDLAFSSTYPDGGEAVTAATVGLQKIEQVFFHGVAMASDEETANPVGYDYDTSKVVLFEGAASGAAIAEKTDSEAHATGLRVRATFIGY